MLDVGRGLFPNLRENRIAKPYRFEKFKAFLATKVGFAGFDSRRTLGVPPLAGAGAAGSVMGGIGAAGWLGIVGAGASVPVGAGGGAGAPVGARTGPPPGIIPEPPGIIPGPVGIPGPPGIIPGPAGMPGPAGTAPAGRP